MKTLLLSLMIFSSANSEAAFTRFWVGFKKQDVTTVKFLNGLNQGFFEHALEIGAGKGLLSYQPYITKMNGDLPDELALLVYQNEEKYKAIRSTPRGIAYGDAHWDFFVKESSKSTVPVPFTGSITADGAYELRPEFTDWQKGHSVVTIYERPAKLNYQDVTKYFVDIQKDPQVNNSMLLVRDKWVIEYRSLKSKTAKSIGLPYNILEKTDLPASKLKDLKGPVGFGEGVNLLF